MINEEKLRSLLMLYKKDKISNYVLERELSEFFGDLVRVKIESTSLGNTSYCIFAVPERNTEGMKLNFIIDENAIKNIYSEDAFIVVCDRLQAKVQNLLTKYHDFYNESNKKETSLNAALGFLLSLYMSYRGELIAGNAEQLPDEADIMKYADLFTMEEANHEDLETVKLKGILSNGIIELARKYVRIPDMLTFNIVDRVEMEKPTCNLGQQEVRKYANDSFVGWNHKVIAYDYLPKTNQ